MHFNFSIVIDILYSTFFHNNLIVQISVWWNSLFFWPRGSMEYEEERELEKGVDEGGWIEYWIRVVNFIGNQKI